MNKPSKDNLNLPECTSTTSIPGLLIIERPVYKDKRGFFHEVFRKEDLEKATGADFGGVQWSHSFSKPGVIRAIHTEKWQKLIYPVTGKMFAAFVDVRQDLPSFGKVKTMVFDNTAQSSTHKSVYIPPGVGNSVCVHGEEPVHYMYLVTDYWDNDKAQGIAWDDSDLNIKWPVKDPIISKRDRNNPTLRELYPEKFK